jgi:hypothetical protein
MLRYHMAYFLPKSPDRMVVAEVLDFPGVVSQGFADARLMISSGARSVTWHRLISEGRWHRLISEGRALPVPSAEGMADDADLIELLPLSVEAELPGR